MAFAGAFVLGNCGGDDELSQVDACKQLYGTICDRVFQCYTKDQTSLPLFQQVFGLNASDCKVKFQGTQCTDANARCDLGETYHADKAKACVDGATGLSCADVMKDEIPTPAACEQVCTK
jgi:hypothetical protein